MNFANFFLLFSLIFSLSIHGYSIDKDPEKTGDITTAKLSVEEGAQVDATIVMKTGKQLKAIESESANDKKSEAEKTA